MRGKDGGGGEAFSVLATHTHTHTHTHLISIHVQGASTALSIPLPFLVTILLPIVGNAAEHASAIIFAVRNRIELALGVAVGSSTQVRALIFFEGGGRLKG